MASNTVNDLLPSATKSLFLISAAVSTTTVWKIWDGTQIQPLVHTSPWYPWIAVACNVVLYVALFGNTHFGITPVGELGMDRSELGDMGTGTVTTKQLGAVASALMLGALLFAMHLSNHDNVFTRYFVYAVAIIVAALLTR
jgi:hypothetical protein